MENKMIIYNKFKKECANYINLQASDDKLQSTAQSFIKQSFFYKYPYNFEYMGRPIIQYPQDMVAIQELIWEIKPDLIIETGIAHGGSLIMSASMLALLNFCEAIASGTTLDPKHSRRKVLGIDIDIRAHNRDAIEAHPMSSLIEMIEGSSIAPDVIEQVQKVSACHERVMVCLDSMHTHDHVLAELDAYAPLVTPGSYCVVFDTIIEDMPQNMFPDRPWGLGNNPKTAVWQFLNTHPEFEIDSNIQNKLLITVSPDGFLKKI